MEQLPHIPEEILVDILRCLPRKSRCRFKCVSKRWCNLLSDRNLKIPKTTKAGLVLQCRPYKRFPPPLLLFLRLDNRGDASVDHSIRHNKRGNNMDEKFRVCDSRHGFLLLCNRFSEDGPLYLVYDPITKFLEHVAPPTPTHATFGGVGLVFDGSHFKVIFYSWSAFESRLVFDVYSLEDKEWRRKELEFSHGHVCRSFCSYVQPLFFKSAMHWPLDKHLLIYHLQDEFCKLIKLPSVNDDRYLEKPLVWACEGQLHYCTVHRNKVDIWVLYMREQNYVPSIRQCFKWQHKHSGVLSLPDHHYSWPFAFNEDFEILYLRLHDKIISYIPETRELKLAYVCPRNGKSCNLFQHVSFPFLYVGD